MTSNEVVAKLVAALERLQVHYMVVGSYSSNVYGVARSTKDADLVVQLPQGSTSVLAAALGEDFRLDPQSVLEFNTFTTRFIVSHVATAFTVELFLLSDDPHDQERFRRRRRLPFLGGEAWLPTPEDVVIMKLRWAKRAKRSKDAEDALNVLAVQSGKLDMNYIRQWCQKHETVDVLDQLLARVPGATSRQQ